MSLYAITVDGVLVFSLEIAYASWLYCTDFLSD
jgi:hypothetical protein